MVQWIYDAPDEQATERLGAALAAELPARAVVALNGALGAGKTRLVQALAAASGVGERDVTSPTFVLVQQYQGERSIFHFDAYRLRDTDEFLDLGPEEYFAQDGVTLIEWAERVESCLPADRLTIAIEVTGPNSRRFTIAGESPKLVSVIERLKERMKAEG